MRVILPSMRTVHAHVRDTCMKLQLGSFSHWEIKGRFRKRVVLANVPSFRFSFWGNIRMYPRSGFRSEGTSECTLIQVFVPGEHPPKPPFWKPPCHLSVIFV